MAEERRRPSRFDSALLGVCFGAKGLFVAEVTPTRAARSAIFMVVISFIDYFRRIGG